MLPLLSGLLLGLLLGMRHACEPDHLAAVSTLVTRETSPAAGIVVGALWGLGHSLALFVVGCLLAVLGSRLPPGLAGGFEIAVALMLVALGARAMVRASVRPPPDRPAASSHLMRWPVMVGIVHGLAGSGALTALALASLPTLATRLLYIALFGVGSVVGMAALTGLAGWPLARIGRSGGAQRWLSIATGAISLVLGAGWGWSAIRGLYHLAGA